MSLVEFTFRKSGKDFNFKGQTPPSSTSRNLEKLHSMYFLQTCIKLFVYYVMLRSCLLNTRVFTLYSFRCLHWEITSERLFNNISLGSSTISNFSCKHKLHLFELGLYDLQLPFMLQDIRGWSFLFANFQYSVDNLVSFLFFSTLKYFL